MYKVFIILYTASVLHIVIGKTGIFTAVSSKTIAPHSVYNITVNVERGGAPTLFTAILSSSGRNYSVEEVEINAGMMRIISLEVDDLPDESYNLQIKSIRSGSKYENSATIFIDRQDRALLIHTDKPVYKPGDVVRFRILVLNRFMKPFEEEQTIKVKIQDPSEYLIKLWNKEKVRNGIFSTKLELSSEPPLGDWTIEVTSGGKTEAQTFFVEQYTLPKFKIDVTLPSYITLDSSKIRAEIKAYYTYGKAIKGQCTATLTRKDYVWNPHRDLKGMVTKHVPIDGSTTIEFDTRIDEFALDNESMRTSDDMEFEVKVHVKDEISGQDQNISSTVRMYEVPYKMECFERASHYLPGLPFTIQCKISTPDNIPIQDTKGDAVVATVEFSYKQGTTTIFYSDIPASGIVTFTFTAFTKENYSFTTITVMYKKIKKSLFCLQKMHSTSRIYIQLTLKSHTVTGGEDMELNLKATKKFKTFVYVVVAKGNILESKALSLNAHTKDYKFKVRAPPGAAPEGNIVAYATFGRKHEVLASSAKFTFKYTLSNILDINASGEIFEPGQNVTFSIKSIANSIVALRGIDQSVLLLKNDKDISIGRIEEEIKKMDENRYNSLGDWGRSASQVFDVVDLAIISNGDLYPKFPYERSNIVMHSLSESASDGERLTTVTETKEPAIKDIETKTKTFKAARSSDVSVRSYFPETWLWEEFWVDESNCSTGFEKRVPDTLTSWIVTGYSLNSKYGIGVSLEPSVLKIFRPFFISLNLPYAVVMGEVLGLHVLVHNYLDKQVTAMITLSNEYEKFEFNDPKFKNEMTASINVNIGAAQVSSVRFVITPKTHGILILNVKGKTDFAGDALSHPLTVKPRGQKQRKNHAVLINLQSGETVKYNVTAEFPRNRVKGADDVKISVVGDILGGSFSNLDKLLQMPHGCGEQNMLNFVPDIVILDYMTSTKRLTPDVKSKAVKYLENGYQRELTYRHYDGSFSAFGNSDSSGSTWLTAFVVRSFVAAKPYITIDEDIILQSLKYLTERQQENGSFEELGMVITSGIKGGASSSEYAITAYTLLAFIEASQNSSREIEARYSTQIEKGLSYIARAVTDDTYTLILISYTLELTRHPDRNKFYQLVKDSSITSGFLKYWAQNEKYRSQPHVAIKPVAVEMTAYALMVYLLRNEIPESFAITKWLLKQRNAEGGFLSTQDTVVGLTALAKFAALTGIEDSELRILAKHSASTQEILVNAENGVVLQEFYLPSNSKSVEFLASGKGTALAQLSWSYYLEEESLDPAFIINIEVKNTSTKLELNICVKYVFEEPSNMVLVEVNSLSGYSFDHDDLVQLKGIPKMKRYDLEDGDNKLFIYFDSMDKKETCMNIITRKLFSVGKHAPAYVFIYDYYDTTKKARAFYETPRHETTSCGLSSGDDLCDLSIGIAEV